MASSLRHPPSTASLPTADRPHLEPFEQLVKMIELELELAGQGRVGELQQAISRRSRFLRAIPLPFPAEAQPLVLRARALHSRVSIETQRLAQSFDQRREARQIARKMARTYVPPPQPRTYSTSA